MNSPSLWSTELNDNELKSGTRSVTSNNVLASQENAIVILISFDNY